MNLTFSQGRIIANHHELVIRLDGSARVTLQASAEDVRLIQQPQLIIATGSGVQWSIHLDNSEQLKELSGCLGIAIDKM